MSVAITLLTTCIVMLSTHLKSRLVEGGKMERQFATLNIFSTVVEGKKSKDRPQGGTRGKTIRMDQSHWHGNKGRT